MLVFSSMSHSTEKTALFIQRKNMSSTIREELAKEEDVLHPARPVDEHREIARAETAEFKASGAGAGHATRSLGLSGGASPSRSPQRSMQRSMQRSPTRSVQLSPQRSPMRHGQSVVQLAETTVGARSLNFSGAGHDKSSTIKEEHKHCDDVMNNHVDRHREIARAETANFSPTRL